MKLWTSTASSSAPSSGQLRVCVAALPDGGTLWSALAGEHGEVRLYHVDGRSSTPSRAHYVGDAVAVTLDGQHIISGSQDKLVKVWSVATKSL